MFHFFVKMLQRNKFASDETYKSLGFHEKEPQTTVIRKHKLFFVILPMKTNNQILSHR